MILLLLIEMMMVMVVAVLWVIVMETVTWCGEGSCVGNGDFNGYSGHGDCACGSSSGHFDERDEW
jgi:hypothetical protein